MPDTGPVGSKPMFIDDLITNGRTYDRVAAIMGVNGFYYAAILVDAKYETKKSTIYGLKTPFWLTMPYDNPDLYMGEVDKPRPYVRDRM